MQVSKEDTSLWCTADFFISLTNQNLLLLFLGLNGPWNRIEFRIEPAVRNSIVLYFDKELEVDFFLCRGALNHNGCA